MYSCPFDRYEVAISQIAMDCFSFVCIFFFLLLLTRLFLLYDEKHNWCFLRNRNCYYSRTRFGGVSVAHIYLNSVLFIFFLCSVFNVSSLSELPIIDYTFCFRYRLFDFVLISIHREQNLLTLPEH